MFAYTSTGSFRAIHTEADLAAGEHAFAAAPTTAQMQAIFPAYVPPSATAKAWAAYQAEAKLALTRSDRTLLRVLETGQALPADWAAYRRALRAILGQRTGDATQPLPARPAWPPGS